MKNSVIIRRIFGVVAALIMGIAMSFGGCDLNVVYAAEDEEDGVDYEKPWFGQIYSLDRGANPTAAELKQFYDGVSLQGDGNRLSFAIAAGDSRIYDTAATASVNSIADANDGSLIKATEGQISRWQEDKTVAFEENKSNSAFISALGFQMLWDNGPSVSVFNSKGVVSTNCTELTQGTDLENLNNFYDLLSDKYYLTYTGDGTMIAMLNASQAVREQGTYSEKRDEVVNLFEMDTLTIDQTTSVSDTAVSDYITALDAGWHVAPAYVEHVSTAATDTAISSRRTAVVTTVLTEQDIYNAMSSRNVYASDDANLSMMFKLDDHLQGDIIDPDDFDYQAVKINISLSDPDAADSFESVYVIGERGEVLYTFTDPDSSSGNTHELHTELTNTSRYYFIVAVQADGDKAISAPVWVPEDLGDNNISKATIELQPNEEVVEGKCAAFEIKYQNLNSSEERIKGYDIYIDGVCKESVIFVNGEEIVYGKKTWECSVDVMPDSYGTHKFEVRFNVVKDILQENQPITASCDLYVKPADYDTVYTVKDARTGVLNREVTLEGTLTVATSGEARDRAFSDCTYLQDATGGICISHVSDSLRQGAKVKVHGSVQKDNCGNIVLCIAADYGGYIQQKESDVSEIEPQVITLTAIADQTNLGRLVKVSGEVVSVIPGKENDTILIKDTDGNSRTVFINGYILNSTDSSKNFGVSSEIPGVGDRISAIGIVEYQALRDTYPVIRVRDRREVTIDRRAAADDPGKEDDNQNNPGYIPYVPVFIDASDDISDNISDSKTSGDEASAETIDIEYNDTPQGSVVELIKKAPKARRINRNGVKYALKSNGEFAVSEFVRISGRLVYVGKKGIIKTGKFKVNGVTYIANKYGYIKKNKITQIGKKLYYSDENGIATKYRKE